MSKKGLVLIVIGGLIIAFKQQIDFALPVDWLYPDRGHMIGMGGLLIAIGLFFVLQALRRKWKQKKKEERWWEDLV